MVSWSTRSSSDEVPRGAGTAVHYGIKFFCTDPVSYSIQIGVDDHYETSPDAAGRIV